MKKPKRVIDYYVLCHKLKETLRTGWTAWNVSAERVESIAEHVYGVQMLAIAMASEYEYDIDLEKVIMMLAIHELEETVIGDLTMFQISPEEKEKKGHEAVHKILKGLLKGKEIEKIILEFDERKTKEAYFAYQCDKLECDLQAKIYGERNTVDVKSQINNPALSSKRVQDLLKTNKRWEEMWLLHDQELMNYDQNFLEVSNYALNNNIDAEK